MPCAIISGYLPIEVAPFCELERSPGTESNLGAGFSEELDFLLAHCSGMGEHQVAPETAMRGDAPYRPNAEIPY